MEGLRISSGAKRVPIIDENDKEKGVLEFNPSRIDFIERYQKLLINFKKKSIEAEKYLASVYDIEDEKNAELSADEDQKISDEVMKEINKLYDFVDVEIDALFGEGSASMMFSKERDISEYDQFLEGVAPYIQSARAEKTDKYSARKGTSKKRNRSRK